MVISRAMYMFLYQSSKNIDFGREGKFFIPLWCTFLLFSVLFRPTLLHESFSTIYLVFIFAVIYVACAKDFIGSLCRVYEMPLIFVSISLLLFFLLVDFFVHGYATLMTSMSGYMIRVLCYLIACHYLAVYVFKRRWDLLFRVLYYCILLQVFIALLMIASADFKTFFTSTIAGFSDSSKFMSEDFIGIRNFGWSMELFYTAPVVMVLSAILFMRGKSEHFGLYYTTVFIVVVISILNARVAVVAIPLALAIRFGFVRSFMPLSIFLLFFLSMFLLENSIFDNFKAEFSGGGSRTLDILFGSHLHYVLNGIENFWGMHYMIYANENVSIHSDIGWVVAVNYGGWFTVILWLSFMLLLSMKAFTKKTDALLGFFILLILGIKGPVFAGNGVIALYALLSSMGGYNRDILKKV